MINIIVLISLYKSKKFSKLIVNNLNSQLTKPNLCVMVDDGYNEFDYIKKNLNKKIKLKIIKNVSNLGHAQSLNNGIRFIKQLNQKSIIFRLDKDDFWRNSHIKLNMEFLKRNKEVFMVTNYSKNFKKFIFDKYYIIDNPTIHSSWVINFNNNKDFRYLKKLPEDFATLSYFHRKGLKISNLNKNTVINNNTINSLSKKKSANLDFFKIVTQNFFYSLRNKRYFVIVTFLLSLIRYLLRR